MNRRRFLTNILAAGTTGSIASAAAAKQGKAIRIVGVSCSPRKGKTTATAVRVALDAAQAIDPRIETELIDLGGLQISGSLGGSNSAEAKQSEDDFEIEVLPCLRDPVPDGLIIGSPCYFRSMSALCKAFLERIAVLRVPKAPSCRHARGGRHRGCVPQWRPGTGHSGDSNCYAVS